MGPALSHGAHQLPVHSPGQDKGCQGEGADTLSLQLVLELLHALLHTLLLLLPLAMGLGIATAAGSFASTSPEQDTTRGSAR